MTIGQIVFKERGEGTRRFWLSFFPFLLLVGPVLLRFSFMKMRTLWTHSEKKTSSTTRRKGRKGWPSCVYTFNLFSSSSTRKLTLRDWSTSGFLLLIYKFCVGVLLHQVDLKRNKETKRLIKNTLNSVNFKSKIKLRIQNKMSSCDAILMKSFHSFVREIFFFP